MLSLRNSSSSRDRGMNSKKNSSKEVMKQLYEPYQIYEVLVQ